jgi:hypothetical protein
MTILKVQYAIVSEQQRLAELCATASDAAFVLAQIVRADIAAGTINGRTLERRFPEAVSSFRKSWDAARHAARLNADSPDEPEKWQTLRVKVGQRMKSLSLGPQLLSNDPTRCKKVSIERIHRAAGLLAVVARQLRLDSQEARALLIRNWGKDEYELAEFHTAHGLSAGGLADGWIAEHFDTANTERDVLAAARKKVLGLIRQRRNRGKAASVTEG